MMTSFQDLKSQGLVQGKNRIIFIPFNHVISEFVVQRLAIQFELEIIDNDKMGTFNDFFVYENIFFLLDNIL